MKQGLRGNLLPQSQAEFELLLADGNATFKKCCNCNHDFAGRTHTLLGWQETQISGWCEECFDDAFAEDDE